MPPKKTVGATKGRKVKTIKHEDDKKDEIIVKRIEDTDSEIEECSKQKPADESSDSGDNHVDSDDDIGSDDDGGEDRRKADADFAEKTWGAVENSDDDVTSDEDKKDMKKTPEKEEKKKKSEKKEESVKYEKKESKGKKKVDSDDDVVKAIDEKPQANKKQNMVFEDKPRPMNSGRVTVNGSRQGQAPRQNQYNYRNSGPRNDRNRQDGARGQGSQGGQGIGSILGFEYTKTIEDVGKMNVKDCSIDEILKYMIASTHEQKPALSKIFKNILTGIHCVTEMPIVTLHPSRNTGHHGAGSAPRSYGGNNRRYGTNTSNMDRTHDDQQ
jgi:hypothetical protein